MATLSQFLGGVDDSTTGKMSWWIVPNTSYHDKVSPSDFWLYEQDRTACVAMIAATFVCDVMYATTGKGHPIIDTRSYQNRTYPPRYVYSKEHGSHIPFD